jgi:hypothetical protein
MPTVPQVARMIGTALIAAALTLAVAPAAQAAAPPGPPPEGSYLSPAHTWVDPTNLNDDDEMWFQSRFYFTFPEDGVQWVVSSSAPAFTTGTVHCSLVKDAPGQFVLVSCTGAGDPVVGDITMTVRMRSEAGDNFAWTIPITVCPLTGCSPLFSLELANASWEVCPGEDLESLDPVEYVFNTDWNPDEVRIDTAALAAAGGDPTFVSGPPANGSLLGARGSLQVSGDYVVPVTITDGFGGEHTADLDITVKSAAACGQLAATGSALDQMAGTALGMLAVIAAGSLALVAASRRSRRSA